jgi:hypothetical protein
MARLAVAAVSILAVVCCACSGSSPAPRPTFKPMPVDQNYLTVVLGPLTGTGSRTFTVRATRSMSLSMGCIGKGMLTVLGPLSGAMLCYRASLSAGAFGSYYWGHLRTRPGERFTLRVVAGAKTMWDIRVDALPRHCKHDVCFETQSP